MYRSSTINAQLPEWYTLEKKAEKSIKRLSTLKELDYYIKHPDEQLRRLAILRINELKLKDSFAILKEILDEPIETQANKELAAWTLKYISAKLGQDLFISHRLLTRYTGNETYGELYNIAVDRNLPSPKMSFSEMPFEYKVKLKSSDILNAQISLPDTEFDSKVWFSNCSKNSLTNIRDGFKSFFSDFSGNMKTAVTRIPSLFKNMFKKKPRTVKASITCPVGKYGLIGVSETAADMAQQVVTNPAAATMQQTIANTAAASASVHAPVQAAKVSPSAQLKPEVFSKKALPQDAMPQSFHIVPFKEETGSSHHSYYQEKKKYNPPGLKKVLFEVLYILLFPVRTIFKLFKGIYRNKFKIIAALAAIYCLLVFTTFGRALALRYTGVDLRSYHLQAVEKIKSAAAIVWAEVKDLTGSQTEKPSKPTEQSESAAGTAGSTVKTYTVIAKSGLNVRTSPSSSAPKAGGILENGAKVTYLDKSSKDSGGRVWYYIRTSGGINGWVYSGGLK